MIWHMATAEESTEKICSRCKSAPANKSDAWCAKCRSTYQKEYRELLEWRAERRGIIRGILAMRQDLSLYFRAFGGRPFMGHEVAGIVDGRPGPPVASEDAKTT